MSFVRGHGGALDEYLPAIQAQDNYAIAYRHGHPFTIFPIGTSLLSIPFVWAASLASPGLNDYLTKNIAAEFEGLIASIFGAFAGCLFFKLLTEKFCSVPIGLAATIVFCFGTSMWSTATRALWQHGPLALMLLLAMLILARARYWAAAIQYLGVPLAAAFVIRPTAALPIAVLSLYVLILYRPWFSRYLVGAAVVALPWLAFNVVMFRDILPDYYLPQRLSGGSMVGIALIGNLVSPGRGLFVFSPVLLAAIPGFASSMRQSSDRALHLAFAAIVVLHWVFVSRFPQWWGGFCFGPRLMSDILPFVAYFVGFAIRDAATEHPGPMRVVKTAILATLAMISIGIHSQGALTWAPYLWLAQPASIDEHPERIWTWSDLQFTRALSRPTPMPEFGPLLPGSATACTLRRSSSSLTLHFGANGRRPNCLQSGWSAPEAWGTWTNGPEASLELTIAPGEPLSAGFQIIADVRGFVSLVQPIDSVNVLVDGVVVGRWTFSTSDPAGERRAAFSASLIDGHSRVRVTFKPLRPFSPAEVGLSADQRRLGLGVTSLRIEAVR